MPLLAGLIVTLLTALVDFLVLFLSRSVALKIAFSALIVSAFLTLSVALNSAVALLTIVTPNFLVTAFAFLFPDNITACIAAVIACDSVVAGFRLFVAGVQT